MSKELIQLQGQSPSVNIYKIFYMNEGDKVEAFLSEPKLPGKYQGLDGNTKDIQNAIVAASSLGNVKPFFSLTSLMRKLFSATVRIRG